MPQILVIDDKHERHCPPHLLIFSISRKVVQYDAQGKKDKDHQREKKQGQICFDDDF